MAQLRGTFAFDVTKLHVRRADTGGSYSFERRADRCVIRLPDVDSAYPLGEDLGESREDVWGHFADSATQMDPLYVRRFRVDVEFDSDVSIALWRGGVEEDRQRAVEEFKHAERVAQEVAADFLGWVRVERGQSWLGPSGFAPKRSGRSVLLDIDADERLPLGVESMTVSALPDESALEVDAIEAIVRRLREEDETPTLRLSSATHSTSRGEMPPRTRPGHCCSRQ
jgi:hypothetical protein